MTDFLWVGKAIPLPSLLFSAVLRVKISSSISPLMLNVRSLISVALPGLRKKVNVRDCSFYSSTGLLPKLMVTFLSASVMAPVRVVMGLP